MAGGISTDVAGGGLRLGSSRVVLDPIKVADLLRGPDGPVARALINIGEKVKDFAKQEVGVNTGNLRDHIVKRVVMKSDGIHVEVVADVAYAIYHHEGSRAVNGKLMVFEAKGGGTVFTMRRKAIPPNRFLIRALNRARSIV